MVLEAMFNSRSATSFKLPQFQIEWPQPSSGCLWEDASIILQLGLLALIFICFVRENLCKHRTKGVEKYPAGITYSHSYKISTICSTLLLGTHFMLLMLHNKTSAWCKSPVPILSSEIMQVISWAITLIAIYKIPNRKCMKFPWILRTWWFCSFFLSLIRTALDIHLIIVNHDHLKVQDYAGFLCLLASTCLLVISVRGKTGMVFKVPNGITDPLLNGKTEKRSEGKRECLYGKATLFQLITFSWLNPLFAVGFKNPLNQDEVPDVDIRDSAGFLSNSFDESLKHVKERDGTTSPSIYKAIFLFVRKKAAINAFFAVVTAIASYVGPYLIDDFVIFLSEKKFRSLQSGYILALGFLGAKMVETIAQRQWIFGARQLGLRLRAALTSHIYKKGLLLSSQSRQSHSSGEIINYMSVDVSRITDFIWYVNIIWMLPIQISLAVYILHRNLGLGSLVGLIATLMVMACNIPITRFQKRYQSKIMEAKDERMKATSEVLRNMKTLKLQAWDNHYLHNLDILRKTEYNWLWKSLRLSAISAFIFWGSPTFISVVTFGACVFILGIPLTAGRVLSALATFRMLQDPIYNLPDLLTVIAQGKVSVDRIASYLQEDELQSNAIKFVPKDQTEFGVEINGGKFSWDAESENPTLDGIQLQVNRGMKVAICGTVGSGKSSLLSCILGEMPKMSGTVKISGTKAYVPQSPWILTGNVRENILFGNPYDSSKYDRTVEACALNKDLELFSAGDLTEIGERGINMSGGQKQRIQIARAAYQDADLYLFDDPFSAVDAHTGKKLFEDCLMGILKDKTILYVTHQVEFLPAADLILVMQNGKIAQAGTFEELLKQNIGFEVLVGAHSQALESILTVESSSRTSKSAAIDGECDTDPTSNADLPLTNQESEHNISLEITEKDGRLVQDEERETGSIGKEVYWSYLTVVKGGALVPIIILAQSLFQVLQIASNYWMAWACPPTNETEPVAGMNFILLVYALLAAGSSLCVLVRATLVATTGLQTAQKLFTNMLHSVFRAPMAFFDSTPTGRILNRASTDQSVVDLEMAARLGWCAFSIIQILGTIAVMSQVAWEVFVIFIPVTAICIWYQQYYIPTARELARLAGIQLAPILHHFAESLAGAAAIRAFDQKDRFTDANLRLIDNHSRSWFHNVSAMEWLSFRLNQLSNFVFAFSLVLLVSLPEGIINPSIAGLAVTYGINLNILQASVIWNICNAENKMISVERILQYSNLASEAPLVNEECRPPNNWPDIGTICFKNLQIRYAEHLPSVLKDITCIFPGKKKVGVVGRTGSGKSTLIQAIFRIVEPREGSIVIDDVDICKIGLHDLRTRLSIIPQDPTMFEGSIRGNLDPLQQYSDNEIWEALDKCQLGDLVRAKEEKLDSTVVENGENWSVGQRQLFCLGRALLKRSSVLVLDEATASVDTATDGVIQKIISQEFRDRTVVTIAHRIHTIIDSDLVLVLDEGRIAEYDTPAKLLEREDSFFSKLIKEYSMRSQNFNSLVQVQN
ncbi:putative ABC transporter C family member 15 [Cornus florida]|uniref:putative ABC transporter C family member 15 n=1 Tax=Cornus florida TaxID=4283 RepID=UPI00289E5640|nr:putative ABC transporter C family member 15 [Cornus florida]